MDEIFHIHQIGIFSKSENIKCCGRCGDTGTVIHEDMSVLSTTILENSLITFTKCLSFQLRNITCRYICIRKTWQESSLKHCF